MVDFKSLVLDTSAYKIICGDKASNMLSHAYLLVCADKENLLNYLKVFAKIICCEYSNPCDACRTCNLIDSGHHVDVLMYPKNGGDKVLVEDVSALIEETFVKPVEADKKLFIINHAESMSDVVQNKLLKTLEEPPKNVHILIGTTSTYPLLSTVLSRVKKLELPVFTDDKLVNAMKSDFTDTEKLYSAVRCGDGTVSKAALLYDDDGFTEITDLAVETLNEMQSSKDVLRFSVKFTQQKDRLLDLFAVMELLLKDMLSATIGKAELIRNKPAYNRIKTAKGFNVGSIIHAIESVEEAFRRKQANANTTALIEWLLFQILEGKYKWQK